MGAWSGEPFGNDTAADFAWELDDQSEWSIISNALREAIESIEPLDSETASIAIAAAEVVAHGVGRATQTDVYTESVQGFVGRAPKPTPELVDQAVRAVGIATASDGELAELWADGDDTEWQDANSRLIEALTRP